MPLTFPQHIDVIDVTLRDGIQHEEMFLPTETKLWIANRCAKPASGGSRWAPSVM